MSERVNDAMWTKKLLSVAVRISLVCGIITLVCAFMDAFSTVCAVLSVTSSLMCCICAYLFVRQTKKQTEDEETKAANPSEKGTDC